MLIVAQECKDVIYPTKGKSIIFDCCIEKVQDGNWVHFTKNDSAAVIEAVSIIKAGLTLNLIPLEGATHGNALYKGHDYIYYTEKYERAKKKKTAGMLVSGLGLGEVLIGLAYNSMSSSGSSRILMIMGIVTFNVGMPLAISGGVEASNNMKAMAKVKNNTSLSFGTTNHGIGLVLNF